MTSSKLQNNNRCADSEDNNDNNKDGNFICASTPAPSDSNADNAPPGRNNKNNTIRLPRFIGHPNGTILQVFKQKRSLLSSSSTRLDTLSVIKKSRLPRFTTKQSVVPQHEIAHESSSHLQYSNESANEIVKRHEIEPKMKMKAETNQNGTEQPVKHLPRFISHPNGMVLRVLKF